MRTRISRGGFWNTLLVDEERLQLGHWPFDPIVISRQSTEGVRFQRVSLPFWWGTDVMFDTDGPGRRYIFNPYRPGRLRDRLQSHGWPVVQEETLNLRRILARRRN